MSVRQNEREGVTRRISAIAVRIQERLRISNLGDSDAEKAGPRGDDHRDISGDDQGNGVGAEQLLSPEERVLHLLAENGGRMKQAEVVASFDWSESTVSRKLCALESSAEITCYRIGREKLVFLPGEEPESFASPVEQEDEKQLIAA